MPARKSRLKIGVFSHGGNKNLGDEALFSAVMQNVCLRAPEADLVGFTINPDETRQRHGLNSYPIRRPSSPAPDLGSSTLPLTTDAQRDSPRKKLKDALKAVPGLVQLLRACRRLGNQFVNVLLEPKFLLDSYSRLKGVDLLLIAGSQQLSDGYGGAWGFPYTLYKWTILAQLTGTKVALLSVGAGPLDSTLSKFFVRRFLNMVNYRSYRDSISSQLVQSLGVKGSHPVFPDLVYSLQLPIPKVDLKKGSRVVVGANPIPFCDSRYWPKADPARYDEYVRKFAEFAEWLDQNDHTVFFFPTQTRADVRTIDDIVHAMNRSGVSPNVLPTHKVENLENLVSQIAEADFVVATRFHGILISLMMNKPTLAPAYHEKCRALLIQVGQGDYALNIADFETEDLIERLKAMEENAPAIRKQIAESMAPLRKALDEQYDTVFGLIGVHPARAALQLTIDVA